MQPQNLDTARKRIEEIDIAAKALRDERAALVNFILETVSEFKPGDTVDWKQGRRKSYVVGVKSWYGEETPVLIVRNILKDNTLGKLDKVYPYDKPKRSAVPWTKPHETYNVPSWAPPT